MHFIGKAAFGIFGVAVAAVAVLALVFFAIPYWRAPDSLDKVEAQQIIDERILGHRAKTYRELVPLINESDHEEIEGASGKTYYLVTSGYWDDQPNSNIRVIVAISDGGRSAYIPLTTDFIKSPSGSFIGE